MTDPSKMASPKEALMHAKVCIESENLTFFEIETLKMLDAAIPVAELEAEATRLLIRYGIFVGIQHSSPEYVEWRNERARLLANLKALKK